MKSLINDFKKFAMRGNIVDMAIGFTVGAAFSTIAKSIVNDIIMPPVGLLIGRADFADQFWLIKAGTEEAPPYATLADAQEAGAVTINYGTFINNVLAFLIVAIVMFVLIRMFNKIEDQMDKETEGEDAKPEDPSHKKCPYCREKVPYLAIRCPHCTSELKKPANPGSPAPAAGA